MAPHGKPGLPTWAVNPWPVRLIVLGLCLAWLVGWGALNSQDRDWFDQCLRWRQPWAPAVSTRIVHLDVGSKDLDGWPDISEEYRGWAQILGDLRDEGAQAILVDAVMTRGTQAQLEPLRQVLADFDDVVLGVTWEQPSPLPGSYGLLYMSPDPDGILRSYALAGQNGTSSSQTTPSLALAGYLKLLRQEWQPGMLEDGRITLDDITDAGDVWRRRLPANIILDQRREWADPSDRNFFHLSPAQLREWRAHPGKRHLDGKVALLGYVAAAMGDFGVTPLGVSQPKVMIHSTALNDLLQDTWHTPVPRWASVLQVLVVWAAGWLAAFRLSGRRLAACWLAVGLLLLGSGALLIWHTHQVAATVTLGGTWTWTILAERLRLGFLRDLRQAAVMARADMEDPLVLKLVGPFQIVEKLGQGGFATVYRGLEYRTLDPSSVVAIKIVNASSAESPEFRRRFVREIRISGQLDHPNIVRVFDSGDQGGMLYMTMELLKGRSLRYLMEQRLPEGWTLEETLAVLGPIMSAMQYTHQHNVLHRDLKPENVMVETVGEEPPWKVKTVKVVDFGLAFDSQSSMITKSGDVFGTLDYLAPERIQGLLDDARSDQYAIGVIAYEMLAGKNPFPTLSAGEAIFFRLTKDPVALEELRPDLPQAVTAAITRMLARDHEERFESVELAWKALS